MKTCDVCYMAIPESDSETVISVGQHARSGYPKAMECPNCGGDSAHVPGYECDMCLSRGWVNVCRKCESRLWGWW